MPKHIISVLNIGFDYKKGEFVDATLDQVIKYAKGAYRRKKDYDHFFNRFTNKCHADIIEPMKKVAIESFDVAVKFTYKEAFGIKNDNFRSLVFGTIDIREMLKNLGHNVIGVEGKKVKRKQFDKQGNFLGYKEYDNIYEVHEVNGKDLGVEEMFYVVKCWCTSTNKEHFLWVEKEYKDDPLKAIASTFRMHENVIPHIKELKRQGDIMLAEMNEEVVPEGDVRPLTPEEYFGLLSTET